MKWWIAIARWFDNSVGSNPVSESEAMDIDWLRSIPFLMLHLMCFGVIWVGWSWTAVTVAVSLYLLRMFAITGFYHRYFSHRSFETSRWAQFLFAAWGNTAVQKGPLWWAAHHRHHHRHSDEDNDVHSPHTSGLYWSHIGWITCKGNFRTRLEAIPDFAKFPELRFLDRFETLVPVLLATSIFGLGSLLEFLAPQLGTSGPQLLIWGFFISTIALFHGTCTINSLAHLIGKRRYQTSDHSRNSFILALITLGEGWHNNHHHFPASVRQGFYWWEIDITYYVLCFFSRIGLIWNLNPVSQTARNTRRV